MIRPLLASCLALMALTSVVAAQTLPTTGFTPPPPPPPLPVLNASPNDALKVQEGEWQIRCQGERGGCYMFQLALDPKGNPVSEVSIVPMPSGSGVAAAATIVMPLGVVLTRELGFAIDSAGFDAHPFVFCIEKGCFAQIGFDAADVTALKRGAQARMRVVPLGTNGQVIEVMLSLKGFTAAFDLLNAE